MTLKSGIYCITNIINKKIYIGSAVNLKQREINHKSELKKNKHHNKKLQHSYNKHGLENFKWEILEYCTAANLLIREQFYINIFDAVNFGYNICKIAGSRKGHIVSEETKRKISLALTGRVHLEESKQKMSESKIGKLLSVEHKQKLSNSHKNKKFSLETRQKMSKNNTGNSYSAKSYSIINPNGEIITSANLTKFCRENLVERTGILRVINGKVYSYKGYTRHI